MIPTIPVQMSVPVVPFYSQFHDIRSSSWQKVGCGIASLAMIIEYYKPDTVSVNTLLLQAVALGAYDVNAGWIHKGLISVAHKYGLDGKSYNLASLSNADAFSELKKALLDGPVIVSIHYKFNPKSAIPHLVVIDGIENGILHYNDPASQSGNMEISTDKFLKGWKKKYIVMRPIQEIKSTQLS
jgi:ABC-type bacteriocin/lantibiotic exporter with double-glycine peptidase domain